MQRNRDLSVWQTFAQAHEHLGLALGEELRARVRANRATVVNARYDLQATRGEVNGVEDIAGLR